MGERLAPGVYRHYKGGLYRLFFVSRDASDTTRDGTICYVYMDIGTGRVYHRPTSEFEGLVDVTVFILNASGEGVWVTQKVPRFARVGD